MKGFVLIAAGLALMYAALSGKAGDLIVAALTGVVQGAQPQPPTTPHLQGGV